MPRRSDSSEKSIQIFCLAGFLVTIVILILWLPGHAVAGSIAGRVTDAENGAPLPGMVIEITDNYLAYRASTSTDVNGDYRFDGLSGGQYLVRASTGDSGYVAEFYQSALCYHTATLIDLDESQVLSGIDMQLETGQQISGRITDQDTNLPVSGVTVYALPEETLQYPWHEIWEDIHMMVSCFGYGGICTTDTNGRYTINGIPPGRYFVGAEAGAGNTNPYVTGYFGGSLSPFLATLVSVSETEGACHIDIALEKGGIIGGAVRDSNGMGVDGAMVIAERVVSWIYGIEESDLMVKAGTDPNGRYLLKGLPPGNYRVYLSRYSLNPYPAIIPGSDPYQTLMMKIGKGAVIENGDFLLARPPGRITGTVRSASDGSPLRGISLTLVSCNEYSPHSPYSLPAFLYGYGSNYWPGYGVAESFTDVTGQYTLSGLGPGTYIVRASGDSFLRGDVNGFVSRTYTVSGREAPITLIPPNETPGIDLYLAPGGSISGTVRNKSDGAPIPGIQVRAYNRPAYGANLIIKSSNYTDSEGRYRIEGLDRGHYILYIGEDPGIITYSPGPLPYPFFASSGYIDVSGPRSTTSYRSDDYSFSGAYIPTSYRSNYWHVRVSPPEDIQGIDFDLVRGGSISGFVFAEESGEPLASVEVRAMMLARYPDKIYSTRTDMKGFYSLIGLHEGEYQLEALDQKGRYLQSDIRLISVKQGETPADQNFSLKSGGSITGIITDETTGLPIPNVVVSALKFYEYETYIPYSEPEDACVYDNYYPPVVQGLSFPYPSYGRYAGPYGGLWNRGVWNPIVFPVTDAEGRYTVTGLPAGEYRVSCSDPERMYMSEHYPDTPGLPFTDLTDDTFTRLERDLDPIGEIHHCLQVRYQVIHSLKIHLLLRDKNGIDVPVMIRLGTSYMGMGMDGIYLGPDVCFASVLGSKGTIESGNAMDLGHWGILEVNLEDLLAEYFSSSCYDGGQGVSSGGLDAVLRIGLEGNGYRMDYIRLVSNTAGDQISYVDIEGFNYPDMPTSHGWQITSAMAPHIIILSGDHMEGGGGMRVLAETPVQVAEGEQTGGIDMAMALAEGGRVSGRVTDAAETHPLSGICIDLLRIDDQPGSQYGPYETITDQEGEYAMDGLAAGVYAVLARQKNNGPYLPQWYENIQTRLNAYNQDAYPYRQDAYPYMDDFPPASLKRQDLTGFTNRHLEFMIMTRSPFTLSIHVLTDSGKQIRIKFCRIEEYGISIERTRILDTILVPLSAESYSKGLWTRFRYDLNGILEEQLSAQLDRVLGIEIKGGLYCIDDIRLTEEGLEDQVIDAFDYTDSPLNHGWVSDSPPWFASIQARDLGRACLLVTSVSPVRVEEGAAIEGIDFSMRLAGGISGIIVDAKEDLPMSGIQLHAFANHMGLRYTYYTLPYDYASGIMLGNNETLSDAEGRYTITGLLPGLYRVQALDMNNIFSAVAFLYQDIPMVYVPVSAGGVIVTEYASDNLTSLAKDLTPLNITNPKLHVDLIFHEKFAFRVKAEATDGSVMELNFHTGYGASDDWYKDGAEDPNAPAFSVNLWYETSYNKHRLKEDRWESWEVSLDDIVSSKFYRTLKRVKEIRMIGNSYRIASIRFLKEGEADQSADDLDYSDSPLNHGWVTGRPETTTPLMTWDTLIDRMTLDCTPAKLITVEEGTITQGIDFRLLSANRVTGRITDAADGAPLSGIRVFTQTQDLWPAVSSEAYTDSNGRYSLFIPGSLDPANFEINADDWRQMVYADASYPYPVELSAGMEVDGIDMAMEEGARVTGRVTYAGTHAAAEGAFVECLAPDSPYSIRPKTIHSVRTDSGGNYCMTGIPEGGYVIYAMSGDFENEGYYRENRDCLDPPVICESGEETAGIDIRLNPIEKPLEEDEGTYSKPYQKISYSLFPPGGTPLGAYTAFGIITYLSPSLNSVPLGPLTISSRPDTFASVGLAYTYRISLEDPNRWSDIHCYLTQAPPGMTLNIDTCQITWTPALYQVGEHAVKIDIHVPDAGIAGQSFTIHVLPYTIIESAEGDASPLLNGEWGILQGAGAFTDSSDPQLQSRVLLTEADEPDLLDFRIGYPQISPLQNPRPYLSFALRSDHDFRFCVRVNADGEEYILQYAPVDGNFVVSGNSVVYPIGTEYQNGRWHLCRRDLQEDLAPFAAAFEWVSHFEIWGDCRMDDLWLSYQPVDYRIFPMRLYKGLNLISLPIKSENMDSDDLAELCTGEIRRRNAFLQRWEEEFDPVREDQGFVIYSNKEKWVTFKGVQKEVNPDTIASYLKSGINLVSPPSIQGEAYKGSDLLDDLKASNQQVLGIHRFDPRKGSWSSNLPFFNRTAGPSFEIRPGEGYLCHIE